MRPGPRIIGFVVAAILATGVYIQTTPGGGGGGGGTGTANIWVDTNGGNCAYHSTPIPWGNQADQDSCGSFAAANAFMSAGGTVLVKCGNYSGQTLSTGGRTAMTVFQSETPQCATLEPSAAGAAVNLGVSDYVTIKDFTINSFQGAGTGGRVGVVDSSGVGAANQNDHIVIDGNWINVGKKLGGCCSILLHAAQNVTISNNTIGPTCCGADVPSSPEGIRIGKPSSAAADCTTEACNITITNNLMQFISDNATHWPVSGFGSAPEATCANSSLCHQDAIHIWGCELCHINYNRLYGNACTGIFLEGTSGSTMSSMEMIGNAITAMANQCNGGVGVNFVGSGWSGTWNIKFNSFGSQLNMVFNTSSTFTLNLIGNYGALYTQRATGGNAGCTGAFPATVTAVYRYNAWTNGFNCDGTDAIGATPSWFSYAAAPAVGQDMHLNGGPAVDFVPAAVTGGCPATDFDGDIPGSPCNAGADQ